MGKISGQPGCHGAIRHGFRHKGHEGRTGGGQRQKSIQFFLRQLQHLADPGEQGLHLFPLDR